MDRNRMLILLCAVLVCGALTGFGQRIKEGQRPMTYQAKDYSAILGMPGISDETLTNHFKLYQGYVKNTNMLLETTAQLASEGKEKTPEFAELRRRLGFEFDGMRLHEYYFDNLKGNGMPDNNSMIAAQIMKDYGSVENWRQDFLGTGAIRGVGWVVLYYDTIGDRLMNVWIDDHQTNHLTGAQPLLVMDVWEHAYYLDYQTERPKYLEAFMKNLNWTAVEDRFQRNSEVQKRKKAA